ncbi:hypothetical protein [Roseomonas chloroacetimidivorans]|uniref:hypothetical protein n=1 Tax=Roseomonas chloroacetimidivorans TaxID=1766656 RepID=UPI003C7819DE
MFTQHDPYRNGTYMTAGLFFLAVLDQRNTTACRQRSKSDQPQDGGHQSGTSPVIHTVHVPAGAQAAQ